LKAQPFGGTFTKRVEMGTGCDAKRIVNRTAGQGNMSFSTGAVDRTERDAQQVIKKTKVGRVSGGWVIRKVKGRKNLCKTNLGQHNGAPERRMGVVAIPPRALGRGQSDSCIAGWRKNSWEGGLMREILNAIVWFRRGSNTSEVSSGKVKPKKTKEERDIHNRRSTGGACSGRKKNFLALKKERADNHRMSA